MNKYWKEKILDLFVFEMCLDFYVFEFIEEFCCCVGFLEELVEFIGEMFEVVLSWVVEVFKYDLEDDFDI